jgi:hypothetical protein
MPSFTTQPSWTFGGSLPTWAGSVPSWSYVGKAQSGGWRMLATDARGSDYATFAQAEAPAAYTSDTMNYQSDGGGEVGGDFGIADYYRALSSGSGRRIGMSGYAPNWAMSGLGDAQDDQAKSDAAAGRAVDSLIGIAKNRAQFDDLAGARQSLQDAWKQWGTISDPAVASRVGASISNAGKAINSNKNTDMMPLSPSDTGTYTSTGDTVKAGFSSLMQLIPGLAQAGAQGFMGYQQIKQQQQAAKYGSGMMFNRPQSGGMSPLAVGGIVLGVAVLGYIGYRALKK